MDTVVKVLRYVKENVKLRIQLLMDKYFFYLS